MAKLMHRMLTYLKNEKQRIEADKPRQKFPKEFEKINTATVTPGKKLVPEHREYVENFRSALAAYYNTDLPRREQFNRLVSTCIKCHERECPGPVETINSQKIP